jgi:hypothetical protein
MAVLAANLASVGVVAVLVFVVCKLAQWSQAYNKRCSSMRQFPHRKGHIIWGDLMEVSPGWRTNAYLFAFRSITKRRVV